jgi:hypothetical protein
MYIKSHVETVPEAYAYKLTPNTIGLAQCLRVLSAWLIMNVLALGLPTGPSSSELANVSSSGEGARRIRLGTLNPVMVGGADARGGEPERKCPPAAAKVCARAERSSSCWSEGAEAEL